MHFFYKWDLWFMKEARDNLQKVRFEALKKQPRSDMNISSLFFRQFYCLKSPLVKKIPLCLRIPLSVWCIVDFNVQNTTENKQLSEVTESPVLKRKLDFILKLIVKKLKQY